ncbi:MAG: Homoserine O-acetyltransferase [Candidatus Omnitrophica bacterium ADurb.Bin277]|nr:MAG: Homoserine O-acetyltransferase [Candidatus Omnitrophica bacterium ADurb.Bin277]
MKKNVGIVEPKIFNLPDGLKLESGKTLPSVALVYETYGKLNKDKSNAVLVMHAFTGDAHAAGYHKGEESAGWWDFMIGPGRALDTEKYFVICINVIGGCKGSTGPSSINPQTGKPYALEFPEVTLGDMVNAQAKLIDHLGIDKVYATLGGSMGGMLALEWAAVYPERIECVIPIAATLKHSPQQIAFNEVGRQAIMADPDWNGGDYYGKALPEHGLAVARMLGHITYMSNVSMEKKFSRRVKEDSDEFKFAPDFEVEGYLQYRGQNFVKRFDANSYLYITKAMDFFDLSGEKLFAKGSLGRTRFLVIAFKSDWLYPSCQSQDMVRQLKMHYVDATYCEIDSAYGHDSFLIESEGAQQAHLIRHFLTKRS